MYHAWMSFGGSATTSDAFSTVFPNGESGADVCDRVGSFLESLFAQQEVVGPFDDANVVIVIAWSMDPIGS